MKAINQKKRYRFNARFYVWIIAIAMLATLSYQLNHFFQNNHVPNFHGWTADEVMQFDEEMESLKITYELVYSYDVLHNRVLSQSVKPKTKFNGELMEVTVQVSKGYPIMTDFTGQDVEKVLAFASQYDLKVTQSTARNVSTEEVAIINTPQKVVSQSIPMGVTLSKGTEIEIMLEQ